MRFRWVRLTTGLIAVSSAAVVWQVSGLMTSADHASVLMIAVVLGAGLVGACAGLLTLAPHGILESLTGIATSLLTAIRSTETDDNRRTGRLLMALGVLTYVVLAGYLLSLPTDPANDDQGAFLNAAAEVADSGGPVALIRELFGGRFPEANRHPLYIALLSLHPTASFGRGLSAAIGLATLLLLTRLTAQTRGALVAGIFCLLLATNMAFCLFSTRIVCDVLMVLWGGVVFLLASRAVTKGSFLINLSLGGLLGLAYLTKGTGLLMLVGTSLAAILLRLPSWLKRPLAADLKTDPKTDVCGSHQQDAPGPPAAPGRQDRQTASGVVMSVLLILFGWGIVASPLMVRNARMYGTPLYNVNSWLLFVDTFEQPVPLSQQQTVAETAHAYWQSHTLGEMVRREVSGVVWETFILLRMLGPFPLDDSRVLFGLPLALCALIGILAHPRREHLLLGVWTILFVGVFAWYVPVAAGERFLLPLLAPSLVVAAEGIVRVLAASGKKSRQ